MRYSLAVGLAIAASQAKASLLLERADITSDTCADIIGQLKVVNPWNPSTTIVFGNINACVCLSTLSSFISSNSVAQSAVAVAGKAAVTTAMNAMIKASKPKTCTYPAHSLAVCKIGSTCGFTCKDGFTPSPAKNPTTCVCAKPYTICNGICGIYKACPSGHVKRGMSGTDLRCPRGLTACGIPGRGSKSSWECVNTQNDLESCGGCVLSALTGHAVADGIDCTAIRSVSDVSCIRGQCVTHRCMEGFVPSPSGESCISEEKAKKLDYLQSQLEGSFEYPLLD
ncbi:hypothetical protein NLJ89_g2962 [Agrocybe chaxingu]|uniref:Protein CPL1-like domain-containing protein n=1 Tax=Agrocybe chaxingu TaxID=84603 RepID=A0A9W8K5T8_9AGAR|nr:hypothetical protein NLJ89_g2962 [Agrocybe chaxingu]